MLGTPDNMSRLKVTEANGSRASGHMDRMAGHGRHPIGCLERKRKREHRIALIVVRPRVVMIDAMRREFPDGVACRGSGE